VNAVGRALGHGSQFPGRRPARNLTDIDARRPEVSDNVTANEALASSDEDRALGQGGFHCQSSAVNETFGSKGTRSSIPSDQLWPKVVLGVNSLVKVEVGK